MALSATTLTALFAVYALALLAALLVPGRLSDYLGRRPVILAGLALNVAACVLWRLAPGLTALFAARVLQGLGVGVATGAIGASLLDLQPPGSGRAAVVTTASTTMGLAVGALACFIYHPNPAWSRRRLRPGPAPGGQRLGPDSGLPQPPVPNCRVSGRPRTVPASPELQGARSGGVRASVQRRPRWPWPGTTAGAGPGDATACGS